MIITPNRELESAVYQHIKDSMAYERTGLHASSLIFCNYKAYFESTEEVAVLSDERAIMFCLGHALQFFLFPVQQSDSEVFEVDGIQLTPDLLDMSISFYYLHLAEVKSTRASSAKFSLYDNEHYIIQMKNYCKAVGVLESDFISFFLMGDYKPSFPRLGCWNVKFTQKEIDDNWDEMLRRKVILEHAIENKELPSPRITMPWECKYCDYTEVCPTRNGNNT